MENKKTLQERINDAAAKAKEKINDVKEKAEEQAKAITSEAAEKIKVIKEKAISATHDMVIEVEKKNFCPVTLDDYRSRNFSTPKLIRVLEEDPHEGRDSCEGAIGYTPKIAKTKIFEVIKSKCKDIGITFLPNKEGVIFYKNPYEIDTYLNIEDYFDYIKKKRVNELELIANKLGAKHIKITVKEEKKSFVSLEAKKKKGAKVKVDAAKANNTNETRAGVSVDNSNTIEIICDHKFEGGKPEYPELIYYKGDPDIESLIQMRMGNNPSKEKTYKLKFNQASDINIDVAVGIDAVLEKLQLSSSASIKSEVEKEKRLYFEYFIQF